MPLGITTYVDPGTYIQQKIQPGSVSVSAERVMCIVGIAPRTRRSTDEAIVRGKVYGETLTVAGASPHLATKLANTSDRDRNNAVVYENGIAMGLGDWSFSPAKLIGQAVAGGNITTTNNFRLTLSMDGKDPVYIDMTTKGATTLTQAALELNAALAALPAYGTAYAAVFTVTGAGTVFNITSPLSTSASDIKIFLSYEAAPNPLDMSSTLSGGGWTAATVSGVTVNPTATTGVQAASIVLISDLAYTSGATYTIDYCSVDSLADPLAETGTSTPLSDILYVGSYPGANYYTKNTDYEKTGNTLDWDVVTWAFASLTCLAGAYNTTGANIVRIGINGRDAISITCTAGAGTSATTLAGEINLALNASTTYGPEFAHVASVSGGTTLVFTAPDHFENYPTEKGYASVITFYAVTASAFTVLTGIPASSLPYEVHGVGLRPAFGSVYYGTYAYTRPSTDYTSVHRVYDASQLYDYTTPLTIDNYTTNNLAKAGEIAFENGVSSLFLCQVNDSTAPGTPTQNQIFDAIDVCGTSTLVTDVVMVNYSTSRTYNAGAVAEQVYLMGHVANMCSITEKKYRRAWFGMPRSTSVGDPDTPGTFVYCSTRTLQPGGTSPARGRLMLCAPAECARTLTLEDGTEVDVDLDSTYLAVADAAIFCALPSPSDALLGKFVTGFLTDDTFETYLQAERYTLAGNGVNVNTLDAGRIIMLDPLTTEAGGSKVIEFEEISSSAQKDSVVRAVGSVIDTNCRGVVPDDLADFLVDIKQWIALAIKAQIGAGVIAPFRNSDGSTRDIDLMSDIQAYQDETDPRSYIFRFWFNLKYVAKRFFGEYSVDNPFFA